MLLHGVVTDTISRWPLVTLSLYVDDATLEAAHASKRVAQAITAAATDLARVIIQVLLTMPYKTAAPD